jgi:hypothetical protein
MSRASQIGLLGLVCICGFATPSYSQCASCGADYNKQDRARVDAYTAGQKQGYEQGRRDGANQEKFKNSFQRLIDNAGEMGSAGVKRR